MAHAGRPLRIGIDARAATEVTAGQGRVARELLRALAGRDDGHVYRCYARTAWEELEDPRFEWRLSGLRDPWWHARVAALASRECDVFLSTNSFVTACMTRCPTVPIVYDLVTFDRSLSPKRRSMVVERLTLGLAVRRAAQIIVISEATGRALVSRFPRAKPKTIVALLGVSPALDGDVGSAELPPPGFVLAVGTLEPRKNLPRLAAAYAALPAAVRERHPLVVAGELGWQAGPTTAALDALGANAIRLGRVSDAALAALYRSCAVFCYPSLGEGFGLPVLEAMAAGAAVLTSAVSSLPEVGGEAVAYCDPLVVASIAGALQTLLEDPQRRAQLGAAGRARAAQFSWERTAAVVLEALERAAGP
jgi:glycosyltransferase involved in cell wall biosynthesis